MSVPSAEMLETPPGYPFEEIDYADIEVEEVRYGPVFVASLVCGYIPVGTGVGRKSQKDTRRTSSVSEDQQILFLYLVLSALDISSVHRRMPKRLDSV